MKKQSYDDMLNKERPPLFHPRMSMHDRAAQFAPFAALTGYDETIEEMEKKRVAALENEQT